MFTKASLIVLACALFAGGLLIGHFATTNWPGTRFGSARSLDTLVLDKLKSELDLSPSQTAQIAPVISNACCDLRLALEEHRAQRLAILDEVGTTISPDLTPDQQRRLEALEIETQRRPSIKGDRRIVALF
jgi:hypothetical protein